MQLEFMTDFFMDGFSENDFITSSTKRPPRNILNDIGTEKGKATFSFEPEAEDNYEEENEVDQFDNP